MSYSRPQSSADLTFLAGLLFVISIANWGSIEFSTPILSVFFFMAVAAIVFSKWVVGSPIAQDMRNFIYVAVLFWVLLDPLQMREGIEEFTYSVVAETFLYVAIFLTTVSLGYLLPPSRRLANTFARISEPQDSAQVFAFAIVVYLIGTAPILYYSGGSFDTFLQTLLAGYDWDVDPGWRRGALGTGADYFFTICFLILNATPFLALWMLNRVSFNALQKAALVWIVLSVPLLQFFSGSRRIFAFLVLGLLLYLYNAAPHQKRKALGMILVFAVFFLLLAMQAQLQFRAGGFYDADLAMLDTNIQTLHRDNIFYWMLTAVEVMPGQYSFTGEIPFIDLLIHPIPRFLWPGKPIGEGFPFLRWEDVGGTTLTISVIGQFYVAHGLWGVIIAGLGYGWGARNWDELARMAPDGSVRSLIYYMGGLVFFVLGIRNFGEIVTQWYSVGFLVLLVYFFGRAKRSQLAQGPTP